MRRNLVPHAGLLPAAALAQRVDLAGLVDLRVQLAKHGANGGTKALTVIVHYTARTVSSHWVEAQTGISGAPGRFIEVGIVFAVAVDPTRPESVARFVRACGLGVLATVDASGHPEAALVGLAVLDDGTLILNAPRGSRKVANVERRSRVAVVVGWQDDVTLQIEGSAVVAAGSEREHFGRAYNSQRPGSRALDEDFAVVVVRPDWLRSYDATADTPRIEEARWI